MDRHPSRANLNDFLNLYSGSRVPGLQYTVVDANGTLFEYAGGWADVQNRVAMTPDTTLMAYSMTKTFTAVSVLQLVEQGRLDLDEPVGGLLSSFPYPETITIRELISHSSGIPNPIPLRWVHLAEVDETFDEGTALANVLKANPRLSFKPGTKYGYSNIGYWLLGGVIEATTNQRYADYVRGHVLRPLGLDSGRIGFVIPDPQGHAKGYLRKYALMNFLKPFVTDRNIWGHYEGKWLQIRSHYVNGPAFGGLVGSAGPFGRFLQDQLRETSTLLGKTGQRLLYTEQKASDGKPLGMTLGWHVGELQGVKYLFKEGGGGGFHSEMRLYPSRQFASVVMVNDTDFSSSAFLGRLDTVFLGAE